MVKSGKSDKPHLCCTCACFRRTHFFGDKKGYGECTSGVMPYPCNPFNQLDNCWRSKDFGYGKLIDVEATSD